MKLRMTSVVLSLLLMSSVILMPRSAEATHQVTNIPVTGRGPSGSTFTGTLDITGFTVQNGALVAVGRLDGTLFHRNGQVLRRLIGLIIALPVLDIIAGRQCEILTLVLGPLDLNVLGLRIELNRVVLEITADPRGGILGSLLCAIADAFGLGDLLGAAALLNQLLGLLR